MDFPSHFQHIFRQLNHQRLHAQLCDCVVLVGGRTFQAHRAILAASSSHFRALLSSNDSGDEGGGPSTNKTECGGPSVMELDPEVVTPEAFSTLLDMIYTSTLSLGNSNVMDVLLAASHLHLNAVVKACKLHLSKKNFPSAPPKGWRSVQTLDSSQQKHVYQQVTSGLEEDSEEDAVVEVSQSGGSEDKTPLLSRHKRKSEDELLCVRKKPSTGPGDLYGECSPTVSMSLLSAEDNGEDLLSPDSLRLPEKLWESPGEEEEEVEEKYEATKGELDEIQVPSQSDSSFGDICNWDKVNQNDGESVVKVKVGEESAVQEAPMITMIEVKRENLNSPELKPVTDDTLQCLEASTNQLNVAKISTAEVDESILGSHLCTNLNSDIDKDSGDTEDDPVGLDSLSDLAFSCFLNPTTESVMGALEEDSLASLTAAATAAAAASDSTLSMDNSVLCQNENQTNSSSTQSSDSALGFSVPAVPLQPLQPTQSSGFTDALILQPAPNPLTGYLSSLGPGLTLEASVVQPSTSISKTRAGGSSGLTAFRRIAPKVPPESEVSADPSGETTERPSLTRASEDIMSKCKKAAAEDHVLLVEGDKKYACKICCKTFMNLTDCKKHIRVHTGEKPYPCHKCGKRFSQSSHLYKHTKNSCQNWKSDQAFSDSLSA